MKITALVFLLLLVSGMAVHSAEPSKISDSQAKEVIVASLTVQQRRLPKLQVEQFYESGSSKFWFFTVMWEGLPKGSAVVGNYSVDPYTGDVFSAVASCDEIHTQTLQDLQRRIRASLHLSKSEYHRLKTKGPLCEE
jgi:hypothetical protein